ncbi:MAG: 2Fe-2S iron-sulfur cluster-binding protein [Gemmatimonadota bacterium]|nr:2Fe-2S iron-sulfur cluster-binding protein [Gemmatimonadota bacterium]
MSPDTRRTFLLDGREIPFREGQTVFDAAMAAGVYIPHLCHNPDFEPHSSCRLCTVIVNGRPFASCTQPAVAGQDVKSDTAELNEMRRSLTQMLLVEGNHYCPSCEKSGGCRLQATAYALGLQDNHFPQFFPLRDVDASHPDIILDRDRCILCGLCVRISRTVDRKNVFAMTGRGIDTTIVVDSPTGLLADSRVSREDEAVQHCPVGALMMKGEAFTVPIGERPYDRAPINEDSVAQFQAREARLHG